MRKIYPPTRSARTWLLTALLLLLFAGAPLPARSAQAPPLVEQGIAATLPWSGWWWPAQTGQMIFGYTREPGPLAKHDELTGKKAALWEESQAYHYDPSGPDWWGHCHAWAAASVLEKEPTHDIDVNGVYLHVGDIKGMLTEAHFSDTGPIYGQRFFGNPGDDSEDLYPMALWNVLRQYLLNNKLPLLLDLNPGPQVWTYPAFKYTVGYLPLDADTYGRNVAAATPLEQRPSAASFPADARYYQGTLDLWVATFLVPPDTIGAVPATKEYTFIFATDDQGQLIPNSDHWTGLSLGDHPDFAWYPTTRFQQNPELDYNTVSQLSAQAQ